MDKFSTPTLVSCVVAIALAGCASEPKGLEIRAIKSASDRIKGGSDALAEAQGLLNLGNPGLALEAFRKIQRDQPSVEALTGIAACYSAMGRDDLARRNLEAALALAPKSPQLLTGVAAVMEREGDPEAAALARAQARVVKDQVADAPTVQPAAVPQAVAMVTDNAPKQSLKAEAPPGSNNESREAGAGEHGANKVEIDVERAIAAAKRFVERHRLSASVTVQLPAARPVDTQFTAAAPRLERISPDVVALVTNAKPYWAPMDLQQGKVAVADTRWTALKPRVDQPNVRVLNAARVQGLARAARAELMDRGWRRIDVGDHSKILARSVVYYPADKQRLGKSLAAHFRISSVMRDGGTVTVMLGRDVVGQIRG